MGGSGSGSGRSDLCFEPSDVRTTKDLIDRLTEEQPVFRDAGGTGTGTGTGGGGPIGGVGEDQDRLTKENLQIALVQKKRTRDEAFVRGLAGSGGAGGDVGGEPSSYAVTRRLPSQWPRPQVPYYLTHDIYIYIQMIYI